MLDLEQFPLLIEDPNVIESEDHVLTKCPGYRHLHLIKLSDNLKSLIMLKAYNTIIDYDHQALIEEFGKYLTESAHLHVAHWPLRRDKSTLRT